MKDKRSTKTENAMAEVKYNKLNVRNSCESFNKNIFHILRVYHCHVFVKKISAAYSPTPSVVVLHSVRF